MVRRRTTLVVLTLVACGARTELGVPQPFDAGSPDAPEQVDASVMEESGVDAAAEADAEASSPFDAGPPLLPLVRAGNDHVCAVLPTGAVKCWGSNAFGQLGDGTFINRNVASDVVGLQSGVASVMSGFRHTCAALQDGTIRCWGDNVADELDDGTQINRATPTKPDTFTGNAVGVGAGVGFTCVALSDMRVECWGVGLGLQSGYEQPSFINAIKPAVAVVSEHNGPLALVLTRDSLGNVTCFDGKTAHAADCSSPKGTPVGLGTNVVDMALSAYAGPCFVMSTGDIQCPSSMGNIASIGLLYDGDDGGELTFSSTVAKLVLMYNASCVLLTSGGVQCWGQSPGLLGGGKIFVDAYTVVDVVGISDAVDLTAGRDFACATHASGKVSCWGNNASGQLGAGTPVKLSYVPVDVLGIP